LERLQLRVRLLDVSISSSLTDVVGEFRIVRTLPRQEHAEPTFKLVVKSEYILKACKDVIQSWPGVSWNNAPLEVSISIIRAVVR